MKYAIYQPTFHKRADEWTVRMDVVGTAEHCDSAEQAIEAAKQAGFVAPVVGPYQEKTQ